MNSKNSNKGPTDIPPQYPSLSIALLTRTLLPYKVLVSYRLHSPLQQPASPGSPLTIYVNLEFVKVWTDLTGCVSKWILSRHNVLWSQVESGEPLFWCQNIILPILHQSSPTWQAYGLEYRLSLSRNYSCPHGDIPRSICCCVRLC